MRRPYEQTLFLHQFTFPYYRRLIRANRRPIASFQHHRWFNSLSLANKSFAEQRTDTQLIQQARVKPVYLPANEYHWTHRMIFAHGFLFASACIEIAHWCLAGESSPLIAARLTVIGYCPRCRNTQHKTSCNLTQFEITATSTWVSVFPLPVAYKAFSVLRYR